MTMGETRSKEARGSPLAGERGASGQRTHGQLVAGPRIVGDLDRLEEPQGDAGKGGQEWVFTVGPRT